MTDLETLRRKIRAIDEDLLKLWKERDEAARRVGRLKHEQGLPLQNFEVEKSVLDHAEEQAVALGLSVARTRTFVRLLIESALAVQEKEHAQRVAKSGRRALIVGGSGLMGAWFARFLEGQGFEIFVEDPRPSPYPPLPASSPAPDVILLAAPPSTIPALLDRHAEKADPKTLILDIASIKGAASLQMRAWAAKGKKVASLHPMFGPQAEVLMGRNVLVLDCGNPAAVKEAKALFSHTTATTHELPVESHDPAMAEILGLSHAVSLVFNQALAGGERTLQELEPFASTTFRKQVDVSREVAKENARLYFEIQTLNLENLKVLARLDDAVKKLRKIVETKDRLGFVDMMHRAQAYYEGVGLRSK